MMLILACGHEPKGASDGGISRTEIFPSSAAALEVKRDGTKGPQHYKEIQSITISLLQMRTNHSAKVLD